MQLENGVTYQLPPQPRISLRVTYTGTSAEIKDVFYPLLAVIPSVLPVSKEDCVTVPRAEKCTHAVFDLDLDALPDDKWVRHLAEDIQRRVRQRFPRRTDYIIRDVAFNIRIDPVNPEAGFYRDRVLNAARLIDMFLEEELEVTGKDEPHSILTIQGVQKHLQYVWMREAFGRGIDVRPLENADRKEADSLLRSIILGRNTIEHTQIRVARRRGGILDHTGDKGDGRRAAECYVGIRYKRKCDQSIPMHVLHAMMTRLQSVPLEVEHSYSIYNIEILR